jgi:molybdopterin-guanine dinucleotide biosynthesis protein A
VTGVLLVGGASRRFGSPKALAELDGETLAERAWRLLGEACDERLAVGKVADGLELPFELVDDSSDVRAPLAGIVAGLRAASHDIAVVIPVDVPLLNAEDVRALAAACTQVAVTPSGPLPGAYAKSTLPELEHRLTAGELKLRDAVALLDVATVDLPREHLLNVNEPADLSTLARR